MDILHGDNIIISRQKLNEEISKFDGEKVRLDGKKLNITELKQATESDSLFGQVRLLVLEGVFSRPASKEKNVIVDYLKESQSENILIWEPKTIDGRKLIAFKKARIQKFDLTRYIFRLVESLAPNNQKASLELLHQCLDQDSPEMVFYMLIRQIKLLIMAKDSGEKGLERMAPWQKKKLTSQANKFSMNQLLDFHQKLLKIDWEQKTGRSPLNLTSHLDLLVALSLE
jgi:DNA polymerase III delta subunit